MGTRCSIVFRCFNSKPILTAICALALIAFLTGISPQAALAQGGVDDPLGAFQLEGNAATDSAICFQLTSGGAILTAPSGTSCASGQYVAFGPNTDDWASALGFGGTSHALATSFIGPGTNPAEQANSLNDTTFFGGGSKDVYGISSGPWETTTTSVQAKDDIEHAFAAAYTLANGHIGIYFGMDRVDNSGDATAGFWFVQDSTISISGAKKGGGTLWTGHHANNDLLIVADYGTGGGTPEVRVFTWTCSGTGAACDTSGSLTAGTDLTNAAAQCNPTVGKSTFCAITNGSDGVVAPWGFVNSKKVGTTMAHGEFLEGGLDLQSVFGNSIPCFSTFFAETRSSTSPTASLEDVTPPISFPLCGIGVTKTCNGAGAVSSDGTSVTYSYSATVTNTGIGPLYSVSLHDTLPDGTEEDINVTLPDTCNNVANSCLGAKSMATVSNITFTATSSNCHTGVTNCTTPLDATNTVSAKGFTAPNKGGSEIDSKSPAATAECKATVSSTVTIEKHCDASKGGATLVVNGGIVEAEVFYVAKVCNTGTALLTNITLADDHNNQHDTPSPSSIASLAPGACTNLNPTTDASDITGSYFPNSIDSTTGRFAFTDIVRVTGATASLGANPTPASGCPSTTDLACAPITCPVCFGSVCTGSGQP